jgi:ferredoxin
MPYRIEIDRSLCSAFGSCADLAPNLIELGPDNVARVRVGTTADEAALDAAGSCPMGAIAVFDLATREQVA